MSAGAMEDAAATWATAEAAASGRAPGATDVAADAEQLFGQEGFGDGLGAADSRGGEGRCVCPCVLVYVCMHACMYVLYVCMYACMYVRVWMCIGEHIEMYVCV